MSSSFKFPVHIFVHIFIADEKSLLDHKLCRTVSKHIIVDVVIHKKLHINCILGLTIRQYRLLARKIYNDDHKHFLSGMCFSFVYFILPKFQGPEFSFLSRNNKRNRTELAFSIKEFSIVKWIEIHIFL